MTEEEFEEMWIMTKLGQPYTFTCMIVNEPKLLKMPENRMVEYVIRNGKVYHDGCVCNFDYDDMKDLLVYGKYRSVPTSPMFWKML